MTEVPRVTFSTSKKLALAAIATLPFLFIYIAHFIGFGEAATGFVHADQPYYMANARAIFERGNGFSYPNPYDPNLSSPAIYFQWYTWIWGTLIVYIGIDPGILYFISIICFGVLLSYLTLEIIRALLPDARHPILLFFFAMWGGGIIRLLGTIVGYSHAFDAGFGWWFLSWGMNIEFATEALYHSIVLGIVLMWLRQRWLPLVLLTFLLVFTHPWTALFMLALLVADDALAFIRKELRPKFYHIGIALAVMAFVSYYVVFLNSFPSHRAIVKTWSLPWTIGWLPLFASIILVFVLAIIGYRNADIRSRKFLFLWFIVALLLSKHELFVNPVQPIHFARGYLWMPLFLLGLAPLDRLFDRARVIGSIAILVFASYDTLLFIYDYTRDPNGELLYPKEREVFYTIEKTKGGTFLAGDDRQLYLSATYSKARPYVAYKYLTPDFDAREKEWNRWRSGDTSVKFREPIQLMMVPGRSPIRAGREIYRNSEYRLLEFDPLPPRWAGE